MFVSTKNIRLLEQKSDIVRYIEEIFYICNEMAKGIQK